MKLPSLGNKPNKPAETVARNGRILTQDPVFNDVLNRADEEVKNKKIADISSEVVRIKSKIGDKLRELNEAIEASKNTEKRIKEEKDRARRNDVALYLEAEKKLSKQEKETKGLISQRDSLVDNEIPAEKLRDDIAVILSEYDSDRAKTKAEILEHLKKAESLMNSLYNQSVAINKVLQELQNFNGTRQQAVADDYKTKHRNAFGRIGIDESVNIVRSADVVRKVAKSIKAV